MAQYVNEGGVWWEVYSNGQRRRLDADDRTPPSSDDFDDIDSYIEAHAKWEIDQYKKLWGVDDTEDGEDTMFATSAKSAQEDTKPMPVYTGRTEEPYSYSHRSYNTYTPTVLVDGVDPVKWRRTYMFLLRFQFSDGYYRDVKYVTEKTVPKFDGDWRKSRWNAQKGCWESSDTPESAKTSMAPYYSE